MSKNSSKFFAVVAALLFTQVPTAMAIETTAKHVYLVDATTGALLLNKEGEVPMVPSSMSKLMTVYIMFAKLKAQTLKPDDEFTVSEKAWAMQGSKSFVPIGGKISVEDLIHGIIIQSGNDACVVAAEGIAGNEEAFVALMNETALKIGLKNSHFKNSSGWPVEGHVMSARDIAQLSYHLINDFPEYYHYFALSEHTFNNITQYNRNRLLGKNGVDGLKTGHTQEAGYGIALSALQDDRRLILVINGLESDDARVEEGAKLLDWGFKEFTNKSLVSANKKIAEAAVWFGNKATVNLTSLNNVVATIPANSAGAVKYSLVYNGPLEAPIAAGAHVADLKIQVGEGGTPQIIPLVAAENIEKLSGFPRAVAVAKYYFSQLVGQP